MVQHPSHQFVDKYYDMDPATEDLLFDGKYLQDGMVVLVGDPQFRGDTQADMTPENADLIKMFNRWSSVSHVMSTPNMVSFLATYGDGTKRKIVCDVRWPWLVKIDSLPMRPAAQPHFDAFASPRHELPTTMGPETTVFRMRSENDPEWVGDVSTQWADEKGTPAP